MGQCGFANEAVRRRSGAGLASVPRRLLARLKPGFAIADNEQVRPTPLQSASEGKMVANTSNEGQSGGQQITQFSVGRAARKLLGPRLFHMAAAYYTRFFGDYQKIAPILIREIPYDAAVLDIGGGDGAPLNYILAARPDVTITMIDPSPDIGGAIEFKHRARVSVYPSTNLGDFP